MAIAAELPEQLGMRVQFDQFLSDREAERRKLFGAEGRSRLIDEFDERFRACAGFKIESAAELITSAWVDEHSDVPGSLSALCRWLVDGERFSADWIANVDALLIELDRAGGRSH
jgi:hypothetical protein